MKKKLLIVSYNDFANSKLSTILEVQPNSRKILETTWLISTTDTAKEFYTKIEPYFDKDNQKVFIAEFISDQRQGWLSRASWDWIKGNQ